MGKGQELVEGEFFRVVPRSLGPSGPVAHNCLLQGSREGRVSLVVGAYVVVREAVSSQKMCVILVPRNLAYKLIKNSLNEKFTEKSRCISYHFWDYCL